MTYEFTDKARTEAEQHAISDPDLERVMHASAGLGTVRDHAIAFAPGAWAELLDRLPALATPGWITRGEVTDLAKDVMQDRRPVEDLFTSAYVWGWGDTGFGRSRYDRILTAARTAGIDVGGALTTAITALRDDGPIKAYEQLYGGTEYKRRKPVGSPGIARLPWYGPAFSPSFCISPRWV